MKTVKGRAEVTRKTRLRRDDNTKEPTESGLEENGEDHAVWSGGDMILLLLAILLFFILVLTGSCFIWVPMKME